MRDPPVFPWRYDNELSGKRSVYPLLSPIYKRTWIERNPNAAGPFRRTAEKLRFIHIAGTNGKGSTTAMCASILREAGYRTGMFVSPYVLTFRERIQVDGQMIPEEEMAKLCEEIQLAVEKMTQSGIAPAEFEVVTALGMLWFAKQNCDVVCLEVGLGGRLDATNVIDQSLVSVICAIGYDHTQILGDTLQKIAFEKCGILKPGGICVILSAARSRGTG